MLYLLWLEVEYVGISIFGLDGRESRLQLVLLATRALEIRKHG